MGGCEEERGGPGLPAKGDLGSPIPTPEGFVAALSLREWRLWRRSSAARRGSWGRLVLSSMITTELPSSRVGGGM